MLTLTLLASSYMLTLTLIEASIGDLLIKLGLQTPEPARYRGDTRRI